jgi:hypothetical protein
MFAFPMKRGSPSDRNAVRNHNGMVFGFQTGIAFAFNRIPQNYAISQSLRNWCERNRDRSCSGEGRYFDKQQVQSPIRIVRRIRTDHESTAI